MADPVSVVAGALVAGATAALKDTAGQAVKDAYAGLKRVIVDRHKGVDVEQLEKNPSSDTRKALLQEELAASGVADDPEALAAALAVEAAVRRADPGLAATVIDAESIKAANVRLANLRASAEGGTATVLRATTVDTPGDFTAEGLTAETRAGRATGESPRP